MTNDDIIKLAREAGLQGSEFWPGYFKRRYAAAVKFATLVTQAERTARQVAQAENEQLKARLARSGVELRAAALTEREACAKACESRYMGDNNREDMEARRCAADIRARGHVVDANKMVAGLALESGEFVPAEKIADWAEA